MSIPYDKWPGPKTNPTQWTIVDSMVSDLDKGDTLELELDPLDSSKIVIKNVSCPATHSTRHTGSSVKGVRCSGSGNRATGDTFVIESSTDLATKKEKLTCRGGGILPVSWTAIDGSGSSPLKEPKPPKPPRTPRTL